MEPLINTINNIREETLSKHYAAAVAELKAKISSDPLKPIYYISSACEKKEIADEVAHRLTRGNDCVATVCYGGLFSRGYYLEVKLKLPDHLIHIKDGELVESTEETKNP